MAPCQLSPDLAVNRTGLSIGDSREITGVQLYFRDTRLERVDGVTLTLWAPTKRWHGVVRRSHLQHVVRGDDDRTLFSSRP